MNNETSPGPSPVRLFDAMVAYQQTAAIKTAIELDLFTQIGKESLDAGEIARRCGGADRGVRILCDYLVIYGFLEKKEGTYALNVDSAMFLDRKSPGYAGGAVGFLTQAALADGFSRLTEAVRKGGTAESEQGTLAAEHPAWVDFARGMGALMFPPAQALAQLITLPADRPSKILDVAAGHGVFGIAVASRHPACHLVALDWAPVLVVAQENAHRAGLAHRFSTVAGSAFDVEFGNTYDAILVPNFLHHFNRADCVRFLRRAHAALRPGGTVAIVEFVPNVDRVTPPPAASFSLVMLATTPEGDAYTFAELSGMLQEAGFSAPARQHPLPPAVETAVIAAR